MPQLFAFMAALPEIMQSLSKMADLATRLMAVAQTNDLEKWVTDLEATIDKLEQSNDPESKLDAAKSLVDAIRGL